jgi:hypothetical protein
LEVEENCEVFQVEMNLVFMSVFDDLTLLGNVVKKNGVNFRSRRFVWFK